MRKAKIVTVQNKYFLSSQSVSTVCPREILIKESTLCWTDNFQFGNVKKVRIGER